MAELINTNSDLSELTEDHLKLLYLIGIYTQNNKNANDREIWIKDLPLKTLIFEGIIDKVFLGYDYAPLSVELPNGRRFLNISQEAEDDLADLREMGLIKCLKLASVTSRLTQAYRITLKGYKIAIPQEYRKQVEALSNCDRCGNRIQIEIDIEDQDENIYLVCHNAECGLKTVSGITQIEDVSYSTSPYFPARPIYIEYEKHGDALKFMKVDYKHILDRRVDYFKGKYTSKYEQKKQQKKLAVSEPSVSHTEGN